jgi:hypothetical protein
MLGRIGKKKTTMVMRQKMPATAADDDKKSSSDRALPQPVTEPQARELTPAARRALEEAEARRRDAAKPSASQNRAAEEIGGRGGLDPARYGDWEVKGIASDF